MVCEREGSLRGSRPRGALVCAAADGVFAGSRVAAGAKRRIRHRAGALPRQGRAMVRPPPLVCSLSAAASPPPVAFVCALARPTTRGADVRARRCSETQPAGGRARLCKPTSGLRTPPRIARTHRPGIAAPRAPRTPPCPRARRGVPRICTRFSVCRTSTARRAASLPPRRPWRRGGACGAGAAGAVGSSLSCGFGLTRQGAGETCARTPSAPGATNRQFRAESPRPPTRRADVRARQPAAPHPRTSRLTRGCGGAAAPHPRYGRTPAARPPAAPARPPCARPRPRRGRPPTPAGRPGRFFQNRNACGNLSLSARGRR